MAKKTKTERQAKEKEDLVKFQETYIKKTLKKVLPKARKSIDEDVKSNRLTHTFTDHDIEWNPYSLYGDMANVPTKIIKKQNFADFLIGVRDKGFLFSSVEIEVEEEGKKKVKKKRIRVRDLHNPFSNRNKKEISENIREELVKKNLLAAKEDKFFPETKRVVNAFVERCIGEMYKEYEKNIQEEYGYEKAVNLLSCNPLYAQNLKDFFEIEKGIISEIPKDPSLFFPKARKIKRRFILHVGDTNTGKTYQALEALKKANSGIYLAPLRLLALEVQEKLLEDDVLCSLMTGEEEDLIPGGTHFSKTMEKMNPAEFFDLAVIDEAQMVENPQRGWAFTQAILGVYAKEVHICLSENAKSIVCKIIESCGDSFEVRRYERTCPLKVENMIYTGEVQKGDAYILFSRNKVIYFAGELERAGHKVSVIYGSLPYSARKSEMKKFLNGESDIVVSTDAIGMGVNLPIRRIVFMETEKYNGKTMESLTKPEIKQISGRAGRKGIYEEGFVTAESKREQDWISENLFSPYEDIEQAKLRFPETLVQNEEVSLQALIWIWQTMDFGDLFEKTEMEEEMNKIALLKKYNFSNKDLFKLITIPFSFSNEELLDLWKDLCGAFYKKDNEAMRHLFYETLRIPGGKKNLARLEESYKKCDLIYSFLKATGVDFDRNLIRQKKEEISNRIIEILKEKKEQKKCKSCGSPLSFYHPFGYCDRCYIRGSFY